MRSLSGVLTDCWLDVRELTPGDRVTQEIAHAAATTRCLVIFFSYEYLRSVNCTLEFLTALRYRSSPQLTILLMEDLEGPTPTLKSKPLSVQEARTVTDLLMCAIPGLIVARSVPELLAILDQRCVRSIDDAGIASTIDWWTLYGKARVSRVGTNVRVVPPLLHAQLRNYWSLIFSCRRRKTGDVAGGFALLSGDGRKVRWYRPPDAATITLFCVVVVELCVFAHMFVYCAPDVDELTVGTRSFQGSCLPSSSFLYLLSILPFVFVIFLVGIFL